MHFPIPKDFHSFENNAPFSHCQVCNKNLLEPSAEYCIHKSYNNNEVILEFALCSECRDKTAHEVSKESMMNMGLYIASRRCAEETVDVCNFCETDREELEGYSMGALCNGNEMIHTGYPILVCDKCEMKMTDLISEKTKGFFDRFIGEHFDCPPAMAKKIEEGGFVFI